MLQFKIDDWYDIHDGKSFNLTINPGVNVIIGPNGSGKTTAINQIEQKSHKRKIPCFKYNNLTDGNNNALDGYISSNRLEALVCAMSSSEGQRILVNFGNTLAKLRYMIENVARSSMEKKKCVVLIDAIDSGLDIAAIAQIKDLFNRVVIPSAKEQGVELYVVISANNYEVITGYRNVFSAKSGARVSIKSYEGFREFILNFDKEGSADNGKEKQELSSSGETESGSDSVEDSAESGWKAKGFVRQRHRKGMSGV